MEDAFLQLVLRPWNVVLIVATWGGLHALKETAPEFFKSDDSWGHRFLPLYPIWICLFFATTVPGPWMPPSTPWGQRVVLGVVLGTMAANFEAVARRLGLNGLLSKQKVRDDDG